jgi:hypothetical protein
MTPAPLGSPSGFPAATADRRPAFRCGHRRADRSGCTAAGSGVPVRPGA